LSGGPELRCTYRLRLGPSLGFEHARGLVPYLEDLGVSNVYLSPSFPAREGSTHGYDVIDPTKISDALGGEERQAPARKASATRATYDANDSGNDLKWATAGAAKAGVGLGRVAVGAAGKAANESPSGPAP
jgi:hypothetical protein